MTKQIMCINWGTRYGAPYINRLYQMVAGNITPPFKFVCYTDIREGVWDEVICHDLPPMPGEMPKNTRGKWPKSRLWAETLPDLEGPVLFLDLDVVITGSLDDFFSFGAPEDVVLARNVAKPFHKLGQTSIYRMPVGALADLQRAFAEDPQAVADTYKWEQVFVTKTAPNGIKFWPKRWVRHFRIECIPLFPLNYFIEPRLPRDARVVIFAGVPNPADAAIGQFSDSLPYLPPLQHIARAARQARKFQSLRRYVLPSQWVRAIWQDTAD
ncbi:glycosyl transferase [uncultured Tateyamaria sp.]|uniref:glycosyl transferase n=1 Tax=uncultured Tateyamaria sp. TaxID=455651 RepID=UPI002620E119|nr:glycosyl transferase [uncultured Tateyamaria sp.]